MRGSRFAVTYVRTNIRNRFTVWKNVLLNWIIPAGIGCDNEIGSHCRRVFWLLHSICVYPFNTRTAID